jgi:hypothetical protein
MTTTINGSTGLVLGVGAQVSFPDSTAQNTAAFLGFRNRIINGDMRVAQRGTSGTTGYLVDRWTAANTTAQSQSSDVPSGFTKSLEFSGSATPFIAQRIEAANSADLVGGSLTISFWAKNVSGTASLYIDLFSANALDNFNTITTLPTGFGNYPVVGAWAQYKVTYQNLPAAVANGLELRIARNNESASTTRITGVQIEAGPTATPFERRSYGLEILMCQRYYTQFDSSAASAYPTASGAISQTRCYFPAMMRVTPSIGVGPLVGSSNLATDGFYYINVYGTTYQIAQGAATGNYSAYRSGNTANAEL